MEKHSKKTGEALTQNRMQNYAFDPSSIYFIPLGGCGEIGMNLSLYGSGKDWIMVDCGVTFSQKPDGVLLPDLSGFLPQFKKCHGLVLTHAHEDHLGAVPYLWKFLKCPIYATPFTAYLLREKFKEHNVDAKITEVPLKGACQVGPMRVEFVSLTHSIPEPNALLIDIGGKKIFHTGDWKLDPYPLVGEPTDVKKLIEIGESGITAMVCDSTNVFEEGSSGSEQAVAQMLTETVAQYKEGKVIIACFASNIARIHSCYKAALQNGRMPVLFGRSMQRMRKAAEYCGYFSKDMQFLSPEQAKTMDPSKLLVITTGSQAEPRAALTMMAENKHPFIQLKENDHVIFSSRVIPGNEQAIYELQNKMVLKGVHVITPSRIQDLHVSGHPYRDELKQMYGWLKPEIAIPVHGEDRHIQEHALLASQIGVPTVYRPHNGDLICLVGKKTGKVATFKTGRLFVDGKRLLPINGQAMQDRLRLLANGIVSITIVFSRQLRKIMDRHVDCYGICNGPEEMSQFRKEVAKELRDRLPEKVSLEEAEQFESKVFQESKKILLEQLGKEPVIKVHILWS